MKYLLAYVTLVVYTQPLLGFIDAVEAYWICDEKDCRTLNEEGGPCQGCGKNPSKEQQ